MTSRVVKPHRVLARSQPVAGTLLATLALLLLSACSGSDIERKPQTARPSEPTSTDFGDVVVHYNAIRTDQLQPEIARVYGIERSANRVLVNVAMLTKAADGATQPTDGTVTATARNLNGQLKDLQMRRIQEGPSIYFIGEVGISNEEILVFDIDLDPIGTASRHKVQFKREFFVD
jgi:ABC-type Fe2+-enterobactin transport system substrate-binding protein